MDKKINCSLRLSLKEICLRRMTVILWTRHYNLFSFFEYGDKNVVIELMKELQLPPLLTEQMTYLVKPIETEIKKWIFHHKTYESLDTWDVRILQELCWTNLGTIDNRKSAEKLIRYELFDIVNCFKLACLYCLADYIPVLWEKLPEESKRYFYKEGPLPDAKPSLKFCWPYILKGEEIKLNKMLESPFGKTATLNQYAFEYSSYKGCEAATEYFFRKLTNAEIESSLFKAAKAVIMRKNNVFAGYSSDVFCYLLPLLNPEQQIEIFKEHPLTILEIFLEWPRQDLSLEIAELIWPFLTADEYADALQNISTEINLGFDLTNLFRELFLHGSGDFRKHFLVKECEYDFSFRTFFKIQDSETIKIIFKSVDSMDRKRLIFSRRMLKNFYKSILRGNFHMVELCLQEATLSKEDKEILKEAFSIFLTKIETAQIDSSKILHNFMNEYFKTKVMGENGVPVEPSTETEERRHSNRREYVWEKFLLIVDEGKTKPSSSRSLDEEYISCSSTDSDSDDSDSEYSHALLIKL